MKQKGFILVYVIVALSALGIVAAGLNYLLIGNTENITESVRQSQGYSVADTYRLMLDAGIDPEKAREYIEQLMYSDLEKGFGTDSQPRGVIILNGAAYGYELEDPLPPSWKDPTILNACKIRPNGRIRCTWTSNSTITEPFKFYRDTEFVIRNGIAVEFAAPLLFEGNLQIRQDRSRGRSNNVCFRDSVEVTGNLNTTSLKIAEVDSCSTKQANFNALFLDGLVVGGRKEDDYDYDDDEDYDEDDAEDDDDDDDDDESSSDSWND